MRIGRAFGIALCVFALTTAVRAEPPRVFLLDGTQIEKSRELVRAGDASLKAAMEKLTRDADAAMSSGPFSVVDKEVTPDSGDKHDYMSQAPYFWPNPDTANHLPYIRRDGERNPEIKKIPDHIATRTMSETAQTLALAYYLTGEARYADRAALLLRAFFLDPATRMNPNLQFAQAIPGINTGRGIGIIETQCLCNVVDAAGLLEGSTAWSDADQRGLRDWFDKYVTWLGESKNGRDESAAKNNHGTMYDLQLATFALFVGRDEIAREIFRAVPEKRLAVQIEPDGKQPLELERTKAWSYSIMNIRGHMQLAAVASKINVDLWNAKTSDGRGIRTALDYLLPFVTGETKWPHQQINGFRELGGQILVRRAAEVYGDRKYKDLAAKFPPIDRAAFDHLAGTQLVPNVLDQQ